MDPLAIRVHPADNVAIVVNPEGLTAGARLPDGLVLRETVPQSHKVALHDITAGAPILRYGMPIGYATRAIPGGTRVRAELLAIPRHRSWTSCL